MTLEPNRHSRFASTSSSPLKRSFANDATSQEIRHPSSSSSAPSTSSQSSTTLSGSSRYSDSGRYRPSKLARLESSHYMQTTPSHPKHSMPYSTHKPSHPSPLRGGKASGSSKRGGFKANTKASKSKSQRNPGLPVLVGEINDAEHIAGLFPDQTLKEEWKSNPKSPVANYCNNILEKPPQYHLSQYVTQEGGKSIWRYVSQTTSSYSSGLT